MAVFTHICGQNMCRSLTRRVVAIVAAGTIRDDVRMIKVRRSPGYGGVAVITVVAAGYVRRVFSSCDDPVVTSRTTPENLRVINCYCGFPGGDAVAILTDIRRLNVGDAFPRRFNTVMTAYAIAYDVVMIEVRWSPGDSRMAVVTSISAGNVSCVLACRFNAIVAAQTGSHYIRMVKVRR